MKLKSIPTSGTWGDIAKVIQENFEQLSTALEALEKQHWKCKGFYSTVGYLKETFPTATNGDWAYIGAKFPAEVWSWTALEGWKYTGVKSSPSVDGNFGDYIRAK